MAAELRLAVKAARPLHRRISVLQSFWEDPIAFVSTSLKWQWRRQHGLGGGVKEVLALSLYYVASLWGALFSGLASSSAIADFSSDGVVHGGFMRMEEGFPAGDLCTSAGGASIRIEGASSSLLVQG
jgi:hypothetical protein